jgi:large subunit ribosomal protein L23
MNVLLGPHISEKSSLAADGRNEFVFKVVPNATKPEIRDAVQLLFGVDVTHVTTLNVKGKSRRFGRLTGKRKDWKKAYVTLKAGQDIDFTGV